MSGIKYLLDTNFILDMLKTGQNSYDLIQEHQIESSQCAYSSVTRMELLGYPGITQEEELLINQKLSILMHLPISTDVEDVAIRLRRTSKIRLPDAIIAAHALVHGLELLTFDKQLYNLFTLQLRQ